MNSKISELASLYLDYLENATAVRNEIVQTLRDTDRTHRRDPTARQMALRQMQSEYYRIMLADKLRELKKFASFSRQQLLGEAERILEKRGNTEGLVRPPRDMRTVSEERMYGALRVRWHELIKLARIKPLARGSYF
jgi:hypothetical protein